MTEHPIAAEGEQLTFELDDRPETHIYVASALTALATSDRDEISRRCDIIDQTIIERSGIDGQPWQVHLPVLWSAPRPTDTRTSPEIYQTNREHVRRASGLILLGDHGGSLGAGQEFAWAVARRLPVLVILPDDRPLSRQIAGTPAQMCVRRATADDELRDAVKGWVDDWGAAVESRARSGTGELIIALRAAGRLAEAFNSTEDSVEAIASVAGMSVERIKELFHPEALLDGIRFRTHCHVARSWSRTWRSIESPPPPRTFTESVQRARNRGTRIRMDANASAPSRSTSPLGTRPRWRPTATPHSRTRLGRFRTSVCLSMTRRSEALASWLFQRLNVQPQPPIDLDALAAQMGIREIREADMAEEGRLEHDGVSAIVYIRHSLSLGRRRFTLAHELAHWALAHPGSPKTEYRRIGSSDDEERLCDEIAAALLMPHEWARRFQSRPQNLSILRLMANRAEVSLSAALLRNREVNHWHKSLLRFSLDQDRWRLQGASGIPIKWRRAIRSAPSTHTVLSDLPLAHDCERCLPLCVGDQEVDVQAQVNRTRRTVVALVELENLLSLPHPGRHVR